MSEHAVEIDEDAVNSVFDEYETHQEYIPNNGHLPSSGGIQEPVNQAAENWGTAARFIAGFLNAKVCPNWQVDDDTQQQWSEALAECLEDLLPGGIGNMQNWGPWPKLAFTSGTWLLAGIDFETMTFKPLHPPKDDDKEPVNDSHGSQPQPARPTQSKGTFVIGGSE